MDRRGADPRLARRSSLERPASRNALEDQEGEQYYQNKCGVMRGVVNTVPIAIILWGIIAWILFAPA